MLQLLSVVPPGAQELHVPVPPSSVWPGQPVAECLQLVKPGMFGLLSPAVQSDESSQVTGQSSLGIGDLRFASLGGAGSDEFIPAC